MPAERNLDVVFAEMVEIRERFDREPDAAARSDLNDRLHRLRAESNRLAPAVDSLSTAELERRIGRCRRVLDDLGAGRFDSSMVAGASGFGGGLDPVQTIEHNQAVDRLGGRRELEAELAELLDEYHRRAI